MLKILGALMILFSGTGLSLCMCKNATMRINSLREQLRIFNIISGQIRFEQASLPEIALSLSESKSEYGYFFKKLCEKMKEDHKRPFIRLWQECISECLRDTALTAGDKDELNSFGRDFGSTDRQLQLGIINDYTKRIGEKADELEKAKKSTNKLYCTLGILGSLFIIIVLY